MYIGSFHDSSTGKLSVFTKVPDCDGPMTPSYFENDHIIMDSLNVFVFVLCFVFVFVLFCLYRVEDIIVQAAQQVQSVSSWLFACIGDWIRLTKNALYRFHSSSL